jgi:hypothetical protein
MSSLAASLGLQKLRQDLRRLFGPDPQEAQKIQTLHALALADPFLGQRSDRRFEFVGVPWMLRRCCGAKGEANSRAGFYQEEPTHYVAALI